MGRAGRHHVKHVSAAAGVSIRTLHHYDAIGLLVPSGRTPAGYREYSDDDVLRLQQILIGRELGLTLEAIRQLLDRPDFDRRKALLRQRAELVGRLERSSAMLRAVDAALAAIEEEERMDLKEILGGFDPAQHEAEARERWGDTAAYQEAARRTGGYSAADWQRYRSENEAILQDAAKAFKAGASPADDEVMDVAERHRQSIDRWFYPCSRELHAGLGDLYEADTRFAARIEAFAEGLTTFFVGAIRANARR